MKIEVGQQAPDFSLYNSDKNKVTLSGLKGQNVLLLFFPAAFTGTCTKELCSVYPIKNKGAVISIKIAAEIFIFLLLYKFKLAIMLLFFYANHR